MKRRNDWIWAVLVLAVAAPARGDDLLLPPYTALPPCIERTNAAPVGTVVAVTGSASITSPGCAPAAADCGTVLHVGQQLLTGVGAQVGLVAGSHYLQVADDSLVTVGATDTGATRVDVERGTARVIDVGGQGGTDLEVATPALESRNPGEDVVASAPGKGSSICSYADPIEVREGSRVTSVPSGDCVTTGDFVPVPAPPAVSAGPAGGAAAAVAFTALPISIAAVSRCDVAAGNPGPPPVASPPNRYSELTPTPPVPPPYCVGGACNPTPPPPPPAVCCTGGIGEPPVIYEPPPD